MDLLKYTIDISHAKSVPRREERCSSIAMIKPHSSLTRAEDANGGTSRLFHSRVDAGGSGELRIYCCKHGENDIFDFIVGFVYWDFDIVVLVCCRPRRTWHGGHGGGTTAMQQRMVAAKTRA